VEGEEWDALGLLNRIYGRANLIREKIRRKVQTNDPNFEKNLNYDLRFRAGIISLDSSDDSNWAFKKASQALLKAQTNEKELGLRLYWSSEITVNEIEAKWKREIYEKALRNFSVSANNTYHL
jgi:GGDEF domain-containing protein